MASSVTDTVKMSYSTAITVVSVIIAGASSFSYLKSEVKHNSESIARLETDNKAEHDDIKKSTEDLRKVVTTLKDYATESRIQFQHLNETTLEIKHIVANLERSDNAE